MKIEKLIIQNLNSIEEAEIVFLIGRLPVILGTTMWRHEFIKTHNIKFNTNTQDEEVIRL